MNPPVTIFPAMFAEGYVSLQYGGDEMFGMVARHETTAVMRHENSNRWHRRRRKNVSRVSEERKISG